MLRRKYQGREQSRSKGEDTAKETWYGTENEVYAYADALVLGTYVSGLGYLHAWTVKQDTPTIWEVEVDYRVTRSSASWSEEEEPPSSSSGGADPTPKQYSLSVRNLQIPIESHPSYRACWTHYLLGLGTTSFPSWWSDATNTLLTPQQRQTYMWVSSIAEIPLDPDEGGRYWMIVAQPQKPGVQVFDRACFVVTEKSHYRTSEAAGAAISHNINEISTPPHTFGISGGQWKLDEGSVEHDGKRWVATRSWTRATSWDSDLYA